MQSSIIFHYVLYINCLPPADAGGSRRVFETVEDISFSAGSMSAVYRETTNSSEFLSILSNVAREISIDRIPLIHIDSHADKDSGLEFRLADGRPIYMGWDQVAHALGEINAQIQNRLFVVFCACSAFYINSKLHPKSTAPFSLCVSPYSDISLADIERVIPDFYRALMIQYDIIAAIQEVHDDFELVSSEIFLKDVLVKMARTTIGEAGRKRREQLLTDTKIKTGGQLDFKSARAHIKGKLKITDDQIKELSKNYLCGRPAPFTAEQIMKEARNNTKT